jgi:hypothetical protein
MSAIVFCYLLFLYVRQSVADLRTRLVNGAPLPGEPVRAAVEALTAEVRDLQRQPAVAGIPGPLRQGFNLSKRSQALRMHRRGESPEQIASALELPFQEVKLLLKVHEIVVRNI